MLYEQIQAFCKYWNQLGNHEFRTGDIQKWVSDTYGTPPDSILPSDYCYNITNLGIVFKRQNRLFEQLGRGKYLILGTQYPLTGDVTAKPHGGKALVVGNWQNGVLTWHNPEYAFE